MAMHDDDDSGADLLVHTLIKQHCAEYTVITVTNRMQAMIDCKRVLLLQEGRVLEWDSPSQLLAQRSSLFRALAAEAGLV